MLRYKGIFNGNVKWSHLTEILVIRGTSYQGCTIYIGINWSTE